MKKRIIAIQTFHNLHQVTVHLSPARFPFYARPSRDAVIYTPPPEYHTANQRRQNNNDQRFTLRAIFFSLAGRRQLFDI